MRAKNGGKDGKRGILIRKEEVVEGGHHGGAWKVAYADFVTAMMAFFLLMWLLNATTEDQRKGLADYFSPNNVLSRTSSGTGQPFGGHTPFDKGAMLSDRGSVQVLVGNHPVPQDDDDDQEADARSQSAQDKPSPPTGPAAGPSVAPAAVSSVSPNPGPQPERGAAQEIPGPGQPAPTPNPPSASAASSEPDNSSLTETKAEQARRERRERRAFEQAAQQINDAVRGDPALADLGRQLSGRYDSRGSAHPDYGRGTPADVRDGLRHVERSGAHVAVKGRPGPAQAPRGHLDRRSYGRDALPRPRPNQLGAFG
jgi:chemotaxis protein MotB